MDDLVYIIKSAVEFTAINAVSVISTLSGSPLAPTSEFHIGHDICRAISDALEDLR